MLFGDNLFRQIPDDALEPERLAINFRVWQIHFEDLAVLLSTAPVNYGPVYLYRNEAWRVSTDGVGRDGSGDTGVGATFFKYSGSSKPAARVYVPHKAFWTEDFNHFATSDSPRGLGYKGKRYTTNVGAYRQASAEGEYTNLAGSSVAVFDEQPVDPKNGDLRLRDGSNFADVDDNVPNLSDRTGVNYSGAAPDLGANER